MMSLSNALKQGLKTEQNQLLNLILLALSLQMVFVQSVRSILLKLDFFPTAQFLTYRGQSSYTTVTGGIFSLAIIVAFLALFMSKGIEVIQKKNVESSTTYSQVQPGLSTVTLGPNGDLMIFAIIGGADVTNTSLKYFNVYMLQQTLTVGGVALNQTLIPLEACTQSHFTFNSKIQSGFSQMNGGSWLCPPVNYQVQYEGREISAIMKRTILVITPCNSTLDSSCATPAQLATKLAQVRSFSLTVGIITTQINPSASTDYKDYYVDFNNVYTFNPNSVASVFSKIRISEYQIQTDESLTPFESKKIQSGVYIPEQGDYRIWTGFNDLFYIAVAFEKSSVNVKHERSFRKADDFFSYVGGLIGIILSLIFIMGAFNQVAYYISVGSKLFNYDKEEPIHSNKFNIFTFFSYSFYKLLSFCGCCGCIKDCTSMKAYEDTEQQLKKQLDVVFLMRRIFYLEQCMNLLLTEDQLGVIHAYQKQTIEEAANMRKKYHASYKLDKMVQEDDSFQPKGHSTEQQIFQNQFPEQIEVRSPEPDKKYNRQFSQSSFSSFKTNSLKSLKNKVGVIANESIQGNPNSQIILGKVKPKHYNYLTRQQPKQKRAKPEPEHTISQSVLGQRYFREMQESELKKNKVVLDPIPTQRL